MPTRLFRQGPQLRGGACPPPNRRTGRWDRACLQDSLRSFPLSREVPQLTLGGCPVQRAVGGRACATRTDQQTRPPATCHDPETSQGAREAFPLLRIGFGRPEETMGGPTVGSYSLGPHVSIGGTKLTLMLLSRTSRRGSILARSRVWAIPFRFGSILRDDLQHSSEPSKASSTSSPTACGNPASGASRRAPPARLSLTNDLHPRFEPGWTWRLQSRGPPVTEMCWRDILRADIGIDCELRSVCRSHRA